MNKIIIPVNQLFSMMRYYMKRLLVFLTIFFLGFSAFSDGSRALRLLEKKDYEKLIDHLNKSLTKDSLNPGAKYVYSLLYLDSAFSRFDIDTSYNFINAALSELPLLEEKEIQRLAKDEITDSLMRLQKRRVEAAGFRRARQNHSLDAYISYINLFPSAQQIDSAIYHRNALAYRKAEKTNTYQAFQEFIHSYPDALQIKEATANYERLFFQSQTQDGRLETYIRFLKNNPNTPHRREAERNIFEIVTADNKVRSYEWFLENYPSSVWRKKVFDFLYHRYKEVSGVHGFLNRYSNYVLSDSLRNIAQAELKIIFPVYEEEKYGFVDRQGDFLIDYIYDSINAQLLCGNIQQDFLEVFSNDKKEIISRLGHRVFTGNYNSVEDLGSGLLKVDVNGKFGVVHKSGEILLDFDFEDIELLNHTFIKLKIGDRWGLISLQGRKILDVGFDEIEVENDFVLIQKDEYYAVQNVDALKKATEGESPALFFSFSDYLQADDNHLITFAGDSETLVDSQLKMISATNNHEIHRYFGGWIAKTSQGYHVYDLIFHPLSDQTFSEIQKSKNKLGLKRDGKWAIYYANATFPEDFQYESLVFLGEKISIIQQGEKTIASFSRDTLVDISENQEVKLLKPQISDAGKREIPEYLLVKNKRGIYSVYNSQGIEIFDGRFDEVEALGFEYLLVSKNGKKGLYHKSGKELLKTSYQGIGNYDQGYVSTLLNNKFGIYNFNKNELLLSAKHDKLLRLYNDSYFLSEKGGKLAFVNLNNDIISEYNFEKVMYWNDTATIVKSGDFWAIYDIKNSEYIIDQIELIEPLDKNAAPASRDREKFLFITKESQEGVLSNISGEVVGPTFNDVYNIGTLESPVFFAEKFIPEADFYIIIYYSQNGEIIRKQVFTDDEYWKIYCND